MELFYNPPQKFKFDPFIKSLNEITNRFEDVIIRGDFNINLLPKSFQSDYLLQTFASVGMNYEQQEATNFSNPENPSLIDHVFIKNKRNLLRPCQFDVGSFTTHDLVSGSYNFFAKNKSRTVLYRDYKNVSAEILIEEAYNLNFDVLYDISSVNDQVVLLTKLVNELIDKCVPVKTIRKKNHTKLELNDQIFQLFNLRNHFHYLSRHEKNVKLKAEYTNDYKKYRNIIMK